MSPLQVLTIFGFSIFGIFNGNASVVGSSDNNSNSSMNTEYEVIQDFSGIIGAIGGVLAGAIMTYLFTIRIERRREEREERKEIERKKSVALLVQYELKIYSAHIETQLRFIQKEPNVYGTNEDVAMFMDNFRTLPRHYINMTPEIKAGVFDVDTIQKVEKAYREIQLLIANLDAILTSEDFETRIKNLKDFISKASESISNMISNMKTD